MNGWIIYPRYVGERLDNAFGWLTEAARRRDIELSVMFSEDFSTIYGCGSPTLEDHNPLASVGQLSANTGHTDPNNDTNHADSLNPNRSGKTNALIYKGAEVADYPDFVIMRDYRWVLSRHFELRGIPVINSTLSMMLCRNKMLTHQLLASEGIPTPLTIFNHAGEYGYGELCALFGARRFVVKRIDGSKGDGVFLVGSEEELRAAAAECGTEHICQQFVEESLGRDVRVWVVGGKAVAAVLRYSESSFKSNFSLGGKVSAFDLTPEVSALAERAAGALGLQFAGIDLLFTERGFTVCEVNGNSGFRTLSHVGANVIPDELFEYIRMNYKP